MRTLRPVFAVFVLLLFCVTASAAVSPPSAPEVTTSEFTVTWPGPNSIQFSTQLMERLPGGTWAVIASTTAAAGSINLVRSPGVYEYRVRAAEEFWHNPYEPDVMFVFSTAISVTVFAGDPPVIDPIDVQVDYVYEARIGDIDYNGRSDIYLRRTQGGSSNNGVLAETILTQNLAGQFSVRQASSADFNIARSWPLANITIEFADYNLDDHVDLFLSNVSAAMQGANVDDQMVISSGKLFEGQADQVIPWDAKKMMFSRDLRAVLENPSYFDAAGEPDEDGYRITIDVIIQTCRDWFGWGFLICFSHTEEIYVGEFSLKDLGLDGYLGKTVDKTTYQTASGKPATSSTTSTSMTNKVHLAAAPTMAEYGISTMVGSETQKAQVVNSQTSPSSDPNTLWCVIWCAWDVIWHWDGYTVIYWIDVWEPIKIPGTFDDQNYSKAAFDLSLQLRDTGKILKEATELPAKNEHIRGMIIAIAVALGISKEVIEEQLDEIYDEESGIPNGAMRELLEEMINALCTGVSPQECIEIVEDLILQDGDYDIGTIEDVLDEVWGPVILSETNPDIFDEDWIEINIPVYAEKVREHRNKPNRWWCTYWMSNPSGRRYFGRTSTIPEATCYDAVQARFAAHKRNARFATYNNVQLDAQAPGPAGYMPIRGREQQLIDWALIQTNTTGLPNERIANRIRGVAKLNPFGCLYWEASNFAFGNIAPYTGVFPATCD